MTVSAVFALSALASLLRSAFCIVLALHIYAVPISIRASTISASGMEKFPQPSVRSTLKDVKQVYRIFVSRRRDIGGQKRVAGPEAEVTVIYDSAR